MRILRKKGEHIFQEWYGHLRQLRSLIPSPIPLIKILYSFKEYWIGQTFFWKWQKFLQTWNWLSYGSAKNKKKNVNYWIVLLCIAEILITVLLFIYYFIHFLFLQVILQIMVQIIAHLFVYLQYIIQELMKLTKRLY